MTDLPPLERDHRRQLVWHEVHLALLGLMPDEDLARLLEVPRGVIVKKRLDWKVPRSTQTDADALLGKLPDALLAKHLGLSAATIGRRRRQRKIPPFRVPEPEPEQADEPAADQAPPLAEEVYRLLVDRLRSRRDDLPHLLASPQSPRSWINWEWTVALRRSDFRVEVEPRYAHYGLEPAVQNERGSLACDRDDRWCFVEMSYVHPGANAGHVGDGGPIDRQRRRLASNAGKGLDLDLLHLVAMPSPAKPFRDDSAYDQMRRALWWGRGPMASEVIPVGPVGELLVAGWWWR